MIERDFLGDTVGLLGFGGMRLPVIDGDDSKPDQARVDEMVDAALAAGVNYFDTAHPYHGGMSEIALGKALAHHPREAFFLASKYPGHQLADSYDPAAVFEEQLTKCGVEYFDFYLLHNVYEASITVYTDEQWGIADYFIEQKRLGRIRHLGFSCHGRADNLREFLDYGAHKWRELAERDPETAALFAGENIMEFCQIQLNYLDWTMQDAGTKAKLLHEAGVPIVVMEPLRGGKLAELPEECADSLRAVNPDGGDPVAWAFRWVEAVPGVKVILSGMSTLEQLEQNCELFQNESPISDAEAEALLEVAEALKVGVPCTGCRYCVSSCPQNIDIPMQLAGYNDFLFRPTFTVCMQMDAVPVGQRAQDCIGCGACAKMCPQGIDIPLAMREFAVAMEKHPKWADLCRQRAEAAERLKAEQG